MSRRRLALGSLLVAVVLAGLTWLSEHTGPDARRSEAHTISAHGRRAGPAVAPAARRGPQGLVVRRLLARRRHVSRGSPRRRMVALTFDDGPGPDTGRIARQLRRARAPATFFLVGSNVARHPGLARRLAAEGFSLGDHTLDHRALKGLPARLQRREIGGQATYMRRARLPLPWLFRPPYGSFDATTLRTARRLGMLTVTWTVDSHDYLRPGARAIVRHVLATVRPGAIVLMHDGGGPRGQTAAALPRLISGLRRRRYRLVALPALLSPLASPARSRVRRRGPRRLKRPGRAADTVWDGPLG